MSDELAVAGGIAKLPLSCALRAEATLVQVGAGLRGTSIARAHELHVIEVLGLGAGLHHAVFEAAGNAAPAYLGDLDVGAVGQRAHGLGKLEMFAFHEITEDIAALAAPETVPVLQVGIYLERGRLLVMERAASPEQAALLIEHDALVHEGDQIGRLAHAADIVIGDARHGYLPPRCSRTHSMLPITVSMSSSFVSNTRGPRSHSSNSMRMSLP